MPNIAVQATVDYHGFERYVAGLGPALEMATYRGVNEALGLIESNARTLLTMRRHERNTQTPSRPGEPPAMISGDLARAVKRSRVTRVGDGVYSGSVGPEIVYGRIQELGGVTGRHHATRLPPRPYLRPAMEVARTDIVRRLQVRWSEAIEHG